MTVTRTPNPGSTVAINAGCTCPVLDNNRGRWAPHPARDGIPAAWYLDTTCPVHTDTPEGAA